ncbi:MAG: glycosyltransferase [Streptomycetales bacterium]
MAKPVTQRLAIATACGAGLLVLVMVWQAIGARAGVPLAVVAALSIGVNLGLWSCVSGLRWLEETLTSRWQDRCAAPPTYAIIGVAGAPHVATTGAVYLPPAGPRSPPISIAAIIPAHNEEPVIRDSITSITGLLPLCDIYVASDASTDATAHIARESGTNVLEVFPNQGKAGALEATIGHFRLAERYDAVLFLDADSKIDAHYLCGARRLLADAGVAAVAGYAAITWDPGRVSTVGQVIAAYRDRLYTLLQHLFRFGQTWRLINVTHIAPGFASVYRADVLRKIEMNPPGLIIEDFNMTFQVHRKRLGRIGFSPDIRATSQDPDTVGDYVRQVRRWSLGFWQTVRYNGLWPSLFWLALGLFVLESMVAAVGLLAALVVLLALVLPLLTGGALLSWEVFAGVYETLSGYAPLALLALALVVPDYILTCVMAAVRRRPRYLLLGLGFPVLRVVDAALALWTLPLAWVTRSSGAWRSPARR